MSLLTDLVAFIRDLLKTAPEDPLDPAEVLEADTRARTEWVRNHRQTNTHTHEMDAL